MNFLIEKYVYIVKRKNLMIFLEKNIPKFLIDGKLLNFPSSRLPGLMDEIISIENQLKYSGSNYFNSIFYRTRIFFVLLAFLKFTKKCSKLQELLAEEGNTDFIIRDEMEEIFDQTRITQNAFIKNLHKYLNSMNKALNNSKF